MIGLLNKLREFAVPYLQYQLPVLKDVLKTLIEELKNIDQKKNKRSKFQQVYGDMLIKGQSTADEESKVVAFKNK